MNREKLDREKFQIECSYEKTYPLPQKVQNLPMTREMENDLMTCNNKIFNNVQTFIPLKY